MLSYYVDASFLHCHCPEAEIILEIRQKQDFDKIDYL